MIDISAINRIKQEEMIVARYDEETGTAFINFDYAENRLRLNDTYNIQDDVMAKLIALGCESIHVLEINRPGVPNSEYAVPLADWSGQRVIDYGFGAGVQYPMPCDLVRRVLVP